MGRSKKNKTRTSTGSPKASNTKCPRGQTTQIAAMSSPEGATERVSTATLNALMDTINSLGVKMENNFQAHVQRRNGNLKHDLKAELEKLKSTVAILEEASNLTSKRMDELENNNLVCQTQLQQQQTEIED